MSEPRNSIEDWIIKIHDSKGKKSVKIELFPAGFYREKFSIYDREKFYPRPSFQGAARDRYFRDRYRVKINGRWYGDKAKYQMLTLDEVFTEVVKRVAKDRGGKRQWQKKK